MWIPFFNNKKSGGAEHYAVDIHNELTQKIAPRPSVEMLESGILICSVCGGEMPLVGHSPLRIDHCPHCQAPNFFPMRIKSYWLFEPLGGGGMGSVYHAIDSNDPELEVAVKILPRDSKNDPSLISALLNEAQIGIDIGDHPHIVKTLDMGYSDGEYFSAMEYVEGLRLDRVIDSPLKRQTRQIVLWALQILSAEQHMLECGLLFRDLKPQNIIIDNNGNVKLFDFGLALTLDDAMQDSPGTGEIQGSPFYIPPERIVGAGESLCSEIYSLGMVLFHVIAKQTYYSDDEIAELFKKHVFSLRINNVAGKLPAETDTTLIRILNRMICRTPAHRYQTYKELASELMHIYKNCA